jgi:monooxygenase
MKNFSPPYNPWDQRLCAVPDGDLFEAIGRGDASVVTDRIATFTEHGIQLESGRELAADIIVSATGLNLVPLGNIQLSKEGVPFDVRDTLIYKGLMISDAPNMVLTLGYTNASWTLKADLVAEFFCRTVQHMDRRGYDVFVAHNDDPDVEPRPALDFPSGYVLRAIDRFPKAGSKKPWRLGMVYPQDVVTLRHGNLDDGVLKFEATQARPKPRDAARRVSSRPSPAPLGTVQ